MTKQDALKNWKESAADAMDTAEKLFADKKYHHSLFFLHLAIEKLLKALHQKRRNEPAPPIHNLARLADLCKLGLDEQTERELKEISSFSVSARYDDYKFSFYKKATRNYASRWLVIGKSLHQKFLSLI
ncbi:HEPN domain-containing protein [Candidatus Gottesmanbacteria bacterium]|nr:HEPN domain-containing protein [Candidatus Gottesmanbacteria bacterium]MBI5452195.1 HEPN domain-containing protein [Candidatus Gottesmanbacteria bacterium]